MNEKQSEVVKSVLALAPQTIDSGVTSAYFPIADYRKFTAEGFAAAVAPGKKLTVQFYQAKTSVGGDAKVLGDAFEATNPGASADADLICVGSKRIQELDVGFTHIAVKVDTDDTGVTGGAILNRETPRFAPV